MADELTRDQYKFPMQLRAAMERAATVLTNCADIRLRELDEDMQALLRNALNELDNACTEANLATPRAAPIAAQLDQDAERAARPSFIQWHQEKFGYCLEGDAAFNDGGRQALTWEVWQAALRAKPAAAQLDAELPPPYCKLGPNLEGELVEYVSGEGEPVYTAKQVYQVVAPYSERIRLLDHEVITQKLAAQVVRDRVAFLESERNLMEANRRAYIDGRTAGTAPEAVSWEWRHRLQGGKGWGAWAKISKGRYDRREDYPNSEFRELFDAAPSPQSPLDEVKNG